VRIAALYDIHANLPALDAVLAEIRRLNIDQVVIGGDVLPGPMPRETITRLLGLEVPLKFIYGNGEVAVLGRMDGREPSAVPQQYRHIIRWNAEQLCPEHAKVLASRPKTVRMNIPGVGDVLFCHATPRNENECFARLTPQDRMLEMFAGTRLSVLLFAGTPTCSSTARSDDFGC
jgi:hypothetical protein